MRNQTNELTICNAIKDYQPIRFRYKDELHYREFNPHAVYYSPKDSSKVLAWGRQTKDESEPLKQPDFRRFEVSLIVNMSVLDREFKPDYNFTITAKEFRNGIICAINR
ncbi:MAG: WYL domain-containing protein [Nitrospirota bacterium]|nr:WYL domain-containing protein [Nitrospirota bacterium]